MKRLFHVGHEVLARVSGFEPFPAVIQSVRLTENECSVFYYVKFQGTSEVVPLNGENLEPLEGNKHKFKLKYNDKDFQRESKLRVEALLGAEDEIPDVLMNFVSVDSDFEEVSEDAVKNLGLLSIRLTPSMVKRLDKTIAQQNRNSRENLNEDDEYIDVEDIKAGEDSSKLLSQKNAFSCPTCHNSFKSRKALIVHKQRSVLCRKLSLKQASQAKQIKSRKKKKIVILEDEDKPKISDLANKKVDESITKTKSKWASRSASGYYPCKLCFRKFRSKGEAQLHMSSHKPQVKKDLEIPSAAVDSAEWQSEESDSGGNDEGDRLRHCSSERVRRAEMSARFSELATIVGIETGSSKVRTLETAKFKIEELEKEAEEQDHELACLQERNQRLQASYLELHPNER